MAASNITDYTTEFRVEWMEGCSGGAGNESFCSSVDEDISTHFSFEELANTESDDSRLSAIYHDRTSQTT
jgi:hypothetical protein